MPRKPIDYSNTIIYKICCRDVTITDVYVGHTTNFTQRKYGHKHNCTNPESSQHNFRVYQFIRDTGGWDNWNMVEIERVCCINENEAVKYEHSYMEQLNSTLNSVHISSTHINNEYTNKNEYQQKYAKEIKYYESNKEKRREYQKQYNEANKERIREYKKQYYESHK
jgi:hypothetical protein